MAGTRSDRIEKGYFLHYIFPNKIKMRNIKRCFENQKHLKITEKYSNIVLNVTKFGFINTICIFIRVMKTH